MHTEASTGHELKVILMLNAHGQTCFKFRIHGRVSACGFKAGQAENGFLSLRKHPVNLALKIKTQEKRRTP